MKCSWGDSVFRIAIAYQPPSGTLALDADVWLWDGLTQHWYKLAGGGAGVINADAVNYFDMPAFSDLILKPSQQEKVSFGSGFDVYVEIRDPGAAPNGHHVFALASIVSHWGIQ